MEDVGALLNDVALILDALCRTAVHIHHVAVEVMREPKITKLSVPETLQR